MAGYIESNDWDNNFERPSKRFCHNKSRGRSRSRSPKARSPRASLQANCGTLDNNSNFKSIENRRMLDERRKPTGNNRKGIIGKYDNLSGEQCETSRDFNKSPDSFLNQNENSIDGSRYGVNIHLPSIPGRRNVPSLPSMYLFSWNVFAESSYVDNIFVTHNVDSNQVLCEEEKFSVETTLSNNCTKEIINETSLKATVNALSKTLKDENSNRNNSIPVSEGYYTVQELINSKCRIALRKPYNLTYSELIDLLTTAADQIEEARQRECSPEALDKARQHKLLLLALLGQATPSSKVYRETGASGSQWMFRKIHLVGDSRVHDVINQATDEMLKSGRPFLHCKADLSFFSLSSFLTDMIPKSSVKNRMLVVCSVGIRDVVRIIDEFGVLASIEITLAEMKRIRKEFKETYGNEHEILFADILPVDIVQIFNVHKNTVLGNDDHCTREQLTRTTIKLTKYTYLLAKNMIAEDLSRLKHLPPWDIFANPIEMTLKDSGISFPGLKDGLNPDIKGCSSPIPDRVKKLFMLYNDLKDAPKYNDVKRVVYFVCNAKYAVIEKFWPKAALFQKPTFIFLEEVVTESIIMHLGRYFPLSRSDVLVVWFDVSEVLSTYTNQDCVKHSPLKVFVPRFLPPSQIFDELTLVRKQLQTKLDTSNVVFTTLCPIDYSQLFENAVTSHKVFSHDLERPSDTTLTRINNYLLGVIDRINLYIVQSNRMRGLPAWDLCSHLYQRGKDGVLRFQPPISPSDQGPVKPVSVAKIMMCLGQCGPETIKAINWLEYNRCKSKAPRSLNQKPNMIGNKKIKAGFRNRNFAIPSENNFLKPGSRIGLRSGSLQPRPDALPTVSCDAAPLGWNDFPRHQSSLPPDQRLDASRSLHTYVRFADETFNHHTVSTGQQLYDAANKRFPPHTVSAAAHAPIVAGATAIDNHYGHHQNLAQSTPPALFSVPRNCPIPLSGPSTFMPSTHQVPPPLMRPPPLIRPPVPVAQWPAASSEKQPSNNEKFTSGSMKNNSFIINPKEDERQKLVGRGDVLKERHPSAPSAAPPPADGVRIDRATLQQLIASLRDAHNAEVATLRANPQDHNRYEEQRKEFLDQAVKHCFENNEAPNITSIERVWEAFWKMQLEKSFTKTWEKRVTHLVQVLGKGQDLSQDTRAHLDRFTKLEGGEEHNETVPE